MRNSEEREQEVVIRWSQLNRIPKSNRFIFDYLIHIPNGGKRNIREAVRFKRTGVKAGVSDLFLAYPVTPLHGLWLELKKPKSDYRTLNEAFKAPTAAQIAWIDIMQERGYMAEFAYGADEAIGLIKNYLGL
jgi:hypothetical protein